MMKASYVLLTGIGLAALIWWGSTTLSAEKSVGDTQPHSRTFSRTTPTAATSTGFSLQSPVACDSEPTESCGSPHRSTSGDNLTQELVALRRQVARLDAELAAVRRQLDSSGSSIGAVSPSSSDAEIDEAEARAQEEQEWQEKIASLEWSFRQEPVDATWAAHATEKIHQAYEREELAELLVRAVECRSTLCRVEVALDDQTNQLLPQFALHVADTLPQLTVKPVTDGEEWMVLFLTRDGQE